MFGKVLKYEMRATGLLYGVMLGIGVLFGIFTLFTTMPFGTSDFHYIMNYAEGGMMIIVSLCTMVAALIPVLFFVMTGIRYAKSMYGREGYLSHSLPVSPTSLVLGKFASTMVWSVAVSLLCAFLFFSIIYGILMPRYMLENDMSAVEAMAMFWADLGRGISAIGAWKFVLILSASLILNLMLYANYIFLAVTLANLPFFQKGNTVLAVVFFFIINYVEGRITKAIIKPFTQLSSVDLAFNLESLRQLGGVFNHMILMADVIYLVLAVIHMAIVIWLVKKYTALQ